MPQSLSNSAGGLPEQCRSRKVGGHPHE
jgi:hypothetical protein